MRILAPGLFAALSYSFALAAPVPATETRALSVPQGELDLSRTDLVPKKSRSLQLEINTSQWQPQGYSEASNLRNTTDFKTGDVPSLSVNIRTEGWNFETFKLAPRYGLTYRQLARTGNLNLEGHAVEVAEFANLASARLGLEAAPHLFLFGQVQGSVGVALVPTWIQIAGSEFGEGVMRTSLAWEQTAAVTWWSTRLASLLRVRDAGIHIGYENTSALNKSTPVGSGILAGVRLEL